MSVLSEYDSIWIKELTNPENENLSTITKDSCEGPVINSSEI